MNVNVTLYSEVIVGGVWVRRGEGGRFGKMHD